MFGQFIPSNGKNSLWNYQGSMEANGCLEERHAQQQFSENISKKVFNVHVIYLIPGLIVM